MAAVVCGILNQHTWSVLSVSGNISLRLNNYTTIRLLSRLLLGFRAAGIWADISCWTNMFFTVVDVFHGINRTRC